VCQPKLFHVCVDRRVLYNSLSKPWITRLSLTRRYTIVWTNPRTVLLGLYLGCGMHRSSDKHLACGDEMNLDYCEVTTITGDCDMAIITLGSLYSMLSCQPTLPDALSMWYERCADSRGVGTLPMPYLI
jgi:hypothetical protein